MLCYLALLYFVLFQRVVDWRVGLFVFQLFALLSVYLLCYLSLCFVLLWRGEGNNDMFPLLSFDVLLVGSLVRWLDGRVVEVRGK